MNTVLKTEPHQLGVLHIADKPYILFEDGNRVQLSLDLRYWYDRSKGWAYRVKRNDSDVIALSRTWAKAQS